MSSMTSHRRFKEWVDALLQSPDLEDLAGRVFGRSEAHPSGPADEAEWIKVFGRHFLDAASYNAAKHGMALGGGAEQRTLTVEEQEVFKAQGSAVSWLTRWPTEDQQRPRRWTQVSRLFSVEAYLVMAEIAAQLMGASGSKGVRFTWARGLTVLCTSRLHRRLFSSTNWAYRHRTFSPSSTGRSSMRARARS
jgi:hypothetical protein